MKLPNVVIDIFRHVKANPGTRVLVVTNHPNYLKGETMNALGVKSSPGRRIKLEDGTEILFASPGTPLAGVMPKKIIVYCSDINWWEKVVKTRVAPDTLPVEFSRVGHTDVCLDTLRALIALEGVEW